MQLRLGSPLHGDDECAAGAPEPRPMPADAEPEDEPRGAAHEVRHLRATTGEFAYGGPVRKGRGWRVETELGAWIPSGHKLALAGLALGGLWLFRNFDRARPAGPEERTAVVTVADLARYLRGFTIDTRAEQALVRTRLFGADGVEYRYAPADGGGPRLICRAMVHEDEQGARRAHGLAQVHLLTDFRLERRGEVGLVEQHDAVGWGDEVRAFRVQEGVHPIGHSLAARKGSRTFYLALSGAVLASDAELERLVLPALHVFERLEP
jgi:hypothetical protein